MEEILVFDIVCVVMLVNTISIRLNKHLAFKEKFSFKSKKTKINVF